MNDDVPRAPASWLEPLQLQKLRDNGLKRTKLIVHKAKQAVGVAKPVVTDELRGYGFEPAFDELLAEHIAEKKSAATTQSLRKQRKSMGGDGAELEVERKQQSSSYRGMNKKRKNAAMNWLGRALASEDPGRVFVRRSLLSAAIAFAIFPLLHRSLLHVGMAAQGYAATRSQHTAVAALQSAIASGFAPAVATLYGTMQAFTISLLTERIRRIQETVGQEAATLSMLTRHSIDMYTLAYRVDDVTLVKALRPLWDHSTCLIWKTRGEELLELVESDPCYRVLKVNSEVQRAALSVFNSDASSASNVSPPAVAAMSVAASAAAATAAAASSVAEANLMAEGSGGGVGIGGGSGGSGGSGEEVRDAELNEFFAALEGTETSLGDGSGSGSDNGDSDGDSDGDGDGDGDGVTDADLKVDAVFPRMDTNGDGYISKEELADVIRRNSESDPTDGDLDLESELEYELEDDEFEYFEREATSLSLYHSAQGNQGVAAAINELMVSELQRTRKVEEEQRAALRAVSDMRSYEWNSLVSKLSSLRSQRLSQEAFPLPPTHFFILGTLGALTALSFVLLAPGPLNTPRSSTQIWNWHQPSTIALFVLGGISSSRGIFALLIACLTLINDFSRDLNSPFGGVYQVRRSVPTAMLLQVRKAIKDSLPDDLGESLMASDDLSVRFSKYKSRKYPVSAALLQDLPGASVVADEQQH